MTDKKMVISCYPTAKCWQPSDDFLIPHNRSDGDVMIYYVIPHYGLQLLSNHCHTAEEAWKNARESIEQKMLKQLEQG
jgi:hypothetical protein